MRELTQEQKDYIRENMKEIQKIASLSKAFYLLGSIVKKTEEGETQVTQTAEEFKTKVSTITTTVNSDTECYMTFSEEGFELSKTINDMPVNLSKVEPKVEEKASEPKFVVYASIEPMTYKVLSVDYSEKGFFERVYGESKYCQIVKEVDNQGGAALLVKILKKYHDLKN